MNGYGSLGAVASMWLFTVRPNMTSPVKASVRGVSGVEVGDALAGVRVGDMLLVGIASLLLVVRGMLFAPHPAKPSKAKPPAASTSRRVQLLLNASKLSVFFMGPFYHKRAKFSVACSCGHFSNCAALG